MSHARFPYRVRVSAAAERALLREWDACRWVWNQCVAESKTASRRQEACGPVRLSKMLTGWRAENEWLQKQPLPETGAVLGVDWGVKEIATTTDDAYDLPHPQFGKQSAVKLARYQRQDLARKWAKRVVRDHDAIAVEDIKPKFLAKSTMAKKAADAAIGATKRALVGMGAKHGRAVVLVSPAYTTMDCGYCGARAKHRLPLSERTYTCTACGFSSPRDKNSARVMLVRAGLNPDGADRVRHRIP